MKIIAAFIVFLVPATLAAEGLPQWSYIGHSPSGTLIYALNSDIRKGSPRSTNARVWVKLDHTKDLTTKVRETKMLFEVNCAQNVFRGLSSNETDGKGNFISGTNEVGPLTHVPPGSIISMVTEALCTD